MINPFSDEYFKNKRIENLLRIIPKGTDPNKIITMPNVNGISLNLINSDIKKALNKEGYYFTPFYRKGNILIQHYSRPVKNNLEYRLKILIQPIDGTKIKKKHTDEINSYDIIITPSNIGKKIMIENGITKPIIVIPNYYSDVTPSDYYEKSDKFTFYSESTGIIRKNIPNLLKYFLETFNSNDNVKLVIKTISDKTKELHDILEQYEDKPEVIIITDYLSESDLESIMKNIDCYICLSHMEGFCIPIINALKWNKKVIALNTEISGYVDFLTNENAYLVKCSRIPIDKQFESLLIWGEESEWEEPDYEHYKSLLKLVINDTYRASVEVDNYSKYSVMDEYKIVINGYHKFNFGDFFLPNDLGSKWLLDNNFLDWETYIDNFIHNFPDDINVIDIGSHVGFTVCKFSKYFKNGKIYAFEPSKISYSYLIKNVDLNNLSNVHHYNLAVGDKECKVGLTNNENLFLNEIDVNGDDIKMVTIDSLKLEKIGLIKIDVEGLELSVLKGLETTIEKYKPVMIIEIHDCNYNEYKDYLDSINYSIDRRVGEFNYICYVK
jgi:FkbM family methyltransferase